MNLDQILKQQKKIFKEEFPSYLLDDYINILSALFIKFMKLGDNKSLPINYRISLYEDADKIKSVINDLKKFN